MASAQPSRDIWHGRGRQPQLLGSPQPRHRSESRRLSDRRRPVKTAARKSDHCPGAVHEGDPVQVFSRTADEWVDGEIIKFVEGDFVRVEYEVGEYWCGKTLHLHSDHLVIPLPRTSLLEDELEEHDPGGAMQGDHTQLPMSPDCMYFKLDFIFTMLARHDAVLIKGSWLLQCYRQGQVLPRRQDLPGDAIWDCEELKLRATKDIALVSISHPWYFREHPDPRGEQVRDVGPIIEAWLMTSHRGLAVQDLAIFWCWCSYYQEPRTEKEQEAFDRTLIFMDLWYTNPHFDVWMLTKVPSDVLNSTSYEKRGWTTWESTVAKFFPKHGMKVMDTRGGNQHIAMHAPLDLGRLDTFEKSGKARTFENMRDWCGYEVRSLPIEPDTFDAIMDEKVFTKGNQDRDLVKSNYRRNFGEVMSTIWSFEYNLPRDWDMIDAVKVEHLACHVLPLCRQLRHLSLRGCKNIGDRGAKALAHMLSGYSGSSLRILDLSGCSITHSGANELIRAFHTCPKMSRFVIKHNDIFYPLVQSPKGVKVVV